MKDGDTFAGHKDADEPKEIGIKSYFGALGFDGNCSWVFRCF